MPHPDETREWQHVKSVIFQRRRRLHAVVGRLRHVFANAALMRRASGALARRASARA